MTARVALSEGHMNDKAEREKMLQIGYMQCRDVQQEKNSFDLHVLQVAAKLN